jgi:hypothetical protein
MIHVYPQSDHLIAATAAQTVKVPLTIDALFAADDPGALLRRLMPVAPSATIPLPGGRLCSRRKSGPRE